MSIAHVNGIEISYEIQRPDIDTGKHFVVLVNGLADTKETWSAQVPALLSQGYPVLIYDNRGVGKSSRPISKYTAELLASDLKALVDKLDIPKQFHLHGVSMGGMIAQSYALAYPDDIRSLTLACTYATPNTFCSRLFDFWEDVAKKMDVATVMRDVTAWAFTQDFFKPERQNDLAEVDAAMRDIDISTDEYLSQLNVIQVFDARQHLSKLSGCPVMVLAGEEDILIPTSLSHELYEAMPHSTWRTVKGGHGGVWEFPGFYNEAMVDFIEEVDTSTGTSSA